jgi:hypothetical protein
MNPYASFTEDLANTKTEVAGLRDGERLEKLDRIAKRNLFIGLLMISLGVAIAFALLLWDVTRGSERLAVIVSFEIAGIERSLRGYLQMTALRRHRKYGTAIP